MKKRIEAALRDLRRSIKRMRELLEWQKLKEQEKRSDLPPSFWLQDHLEADIKIEEGFFLKTAWDVRTVLSERNDPITPRQRKRLLGLEEEMRELTTKG